MNTTHNFSNFSTSKRTVVTIGTFDGVHLGHKKIIEQLLNASRNKNETSVLLTFFPHPRMVLQKDQEIKLINTLREKSNLLDKLGLDELIIHPFDKEFSRLTAFEFVRDVLVNKLNISKLIIGYDHHFGKNREGNFEQLKEYGEMFDFELEEIPAQNLNDIAISSTKIRTAISKGNIIKANKFLGYNFNLTGVVSKGENLGTSLGFPTANIKIAENYKIIPKTGVYVVKSTIENKEYFGMMNIGNRPTVNGKNQTIEIHFFKLNTNLYGKEITVELLEFLRDEQKFDSLDSLKEQLQIDKSKSTEFINNLTSIS
ncbi:bifunctional riboflavin kinase/FAD synthetase [Urechidicola vernalis]|uniref:Riboflavin biosynthesis protein n=1 Tax=Urechidicola vernalis TaxID=3075600 RepID=A0ABU2YAF2_9FLAO|nr:bifunctional riboflavin kinase/FAD synthetase [Urechidicola sp. P050]MDT0554230.1 bifunctional riboflavin kinase/FAD synthetase [Urechidicola sp. P050]